MWKTRKMTKNLLPMEIILITHGTCSIISRIAPAYLSHQCPMGSTQKWSHYDQRMETHPCATWRIQIWSSAFLYYCSMMRTHHPWAQEQNVLESPPSVDYSECPLAIQNRTQKVTNDMNEGKIIYSNGHSENIFTNTQMPQNWRSGADWQLYEHVQASATLFVPKVFGKQKIP